MKFEVTLKMDENIMTWSAMTVDKNGNGSVGTGKTKFEALVRLAVQISDNEGMLQFEETNGEQPTN